MIATPEEHEYRLYAELKASGLDSVSAADYSSKSSANLPWAYAMYLKLLCMLGLAIGVVLISLPFSQDWSGLSRTSLLIAPVLLVILVGIIFPIKARNKAFWVMYSIILVLATVLVALPLF